jgi:hypothetical protein
MIIRSVRLHANVGDSWEGVNDLDGVWHPEQRMMVLRVATRDEFLAFLEAEGARWSDASLLKDRAFYEVSTD